MGVLVEVPLAYRDEPNLNGIYVPKDVFYKALNDYYRNSYPDMEKIKDLQIKTDLYEPYIPIPVHIYNYEYGIRERKDIVGYCKSITNNIGTVELLPFYTESICKDCHLGYVLTTDNKLNYKDDEGNTVVTNAKILGFILEYNTPYKNNKSLE